MTSSMQPAAIVSDSAARAHEQKNCLSIILAVASLVTPELPDSARARMDRLRAAAYRMRDLLDDDLVEPVHRTSDVDVLRLFDTVCERLRDRADAARVSLRLDCGGGSLRAREAELREALVNLVSNAIEATPVGGVVLIRTECTADGGQSWTIRDSGVGMRREVLDQIGVPYRSFRRGGSGLGIALARAIVSRHGGSLSFESVCGRGTTVTVHLPEDGASPSANRAFEDRSHDETHGESTWK